MKKLVIMMFAVLGVAGLLTVSPAKAQTIDNTPDCDTVAIIKCGSFSESELRSDFDKNEYGDLPKVYSAFGISRSELTGFKSGVVWKDGRVTVDGQVVATGAITAGRWFNPTSDMTRIPDTVRAYKMSTSHFVTDGQTAFVKMTNGQFEFAVLKTCGNPVNAQPKEQPKPEVVCNGLTVRTISRTQFEFKATKTVKNTTFKHFMFVVKDSAGTEVTRFNDADGTATYTQTKVGAYSVEAFVVTTDKTVSGPNCKQEFTVKEQPANPIAECKSLKATQIGTTREYEFDLIYVADGGAILRTVDFDFGSGQTPRNGVTPAELEDVRHTYPATGKFTATATLHFDMPGGATKSVKCTAEIPDVQVLGEVVLVSNEVKGGETIPATGAAQVLGAGVGISSVTAAGWYYLRSRRDLVESFLNKIKK